MRAAGNGKQPKRESAKGSLICAICRRHYQLIQMAGVQAIYSICPDCRLTVAVQEREKR